MEVQPETTTPDKEKHSTPWTGFVAWPFVILLLYFLSAGPVMMMIDRGRISAHNVFFGKFYKPLEWAYAHTLLHKPLGMYFHLWAPKDFDKDGE